MPCDTHWWISLISCLGQIPGDRIVRRPWCRWQVAPERWYQSVLPGIFEYSLSQTLPLTLFFLFVFSFWGFHILLLWSIQRILCHHQCWFLDQGKENLVIVCCSFHFASPWTGKGQCSLWWPVSLSPGPWVGCPLSLWTQWAEQSSQAHKHTCVDMTMNLRGLNWSMETGSLHLKNYWQLHLT